MRDDSTDAPFDFSFALVADGGDANTAAAKMTTTTSSTTLMTTTSNSSTSLPAAPRARSLASAKAARSESRAPAATLTPAQPLYAAPLSCEWSVVCVQCVTRVALAPAALFAPMSPPPASGMFALTPPKALFATPAPTASGGPCACDECLARKLAIYGTSARACGGVISFVRGVRSRIVTTARVRVDCRAHGNVCCHRRHREHVGVADNADKRAAAVGAC
jgi:hypothetical protein